MGGIENIFGSWQATLIVFIICITVFYLVVRFKTAYKTFAKIFYYAIFLTIWYGLLINFILWCLMGNLPIINMFGATLDLSCYTPNPLDDNASIIRIILEFSPTVYFASKTQVREAWKKAKNKLDSEESYKS